MIEVRLTWHELLLGAMIGVQRRVQSMKEKRRDRHGYSRDRDPWAIDIEGACAEVAVAKATGRFWNGSVDTFKAADVGSCFQVREVDDDRKSLIVRDGDADTDFFILVISACPVYKIVGYIEGREAKRKEWVRSPNNRPPAWFVPQAALHPIERRNDD